MKYLHHAAGIFIFFLLSCFKADTIAPVIYLKFVSDSYVSIGSDFEDPGFTAKDDRDGDISHLVEVKGQVNSKLAGLYELYYDVSDASSNKAKQVKRSVYVRHRNFTLEGIYQIQCRCNNAPNDTLNYYSSIIAAKTNEDEVIIKDLIQRSNIEFTGYLNDPISQKIVIQNLVKGDTLYTAQGNISNAGDKISFLLVKSSNQHSDTCQYDLHK